MGKGSNSSESTTSPNWQAYQQYSDILNRAAGVASTPYQAFSGESVAPINEQQQRGIAGINQGANFGSQYYTDAGGIIRNAAGPLDINQFQNPYTEQVVNATQADFDRQNARAQSQVVGNAGAQQALGGNRVGVAQGITAEGQARAQAPIIAGLRSSGYRDSVNQAMADAQRRAGAGVQLGQIGGAGQSSALQGATAQFGVGTAEQQTQQAQDTEALRQFAEKNGYDFRTLQWLAGMSTGVGSQMGGTSRTEGPEPNPWTQILGAGVAAASFLPRRERGGRVGGFAPPRRNRAQGGYNGPWAGAEGWVPMMAITHGKGPPAPPQPPHQGGNSQSNQQMGRGLAAAGTGLNNWYQGQQDIAQDRAQDLEEDGDVWARGGRVAGFADGGVPFPRDDPREGSGRVRAAYRTLRETKAPTIMEDIVGRYSESKGQDNAVREAIRRGAVDDIKAYPDVSNALEAYRRGTYADGGRVGYATRGSVWDEGDEPFRDYVPTMGGVGGSSPSFDDRFNASYPALKRVEPMQAPQDEGPVPLPRSRPEEADVFTPPGGPYRPTDPAAMQDFRDDSDINQNRGQPPTPRAGVYGSPAETAIAEAAGPPSGLGKPPGAPEGAMAYAGAPPPRAGVAPPMPQQTAPELQGEQSFLEKLGIRMTPSLRQGLMQAGLAMMATHRGGPGSFLGGVGEGGQAGVAAYNTAENLAQRQAVEQQKLARDDYWKERAEQRADRPYHEMTVAQKAAHDLSVATKETWVPLPSDGIHPDRILNKTSGEVRNLPDQGNNTASGLKTGEFDYRTGAPRLQKGDEVPDPPAIAGHAPDALKKDAETYLTTGVLPKASVSARGPAGTQQMVYQRAVQNYGVALAASKGMNMAQMADLQRFGSKAASFPLSRQGDQTVAIGTAIRHITALEDYAKAWDAAKGNMNFPLLRQAAARFATALGKPEPTNLEEAASIAGPEVIKAIGVAGGGTGGEREAQEFRFKPGAATPQILGAANVAKTFLAGQLPAKEAQARNVGFPHDRFMDMVGPTEYDYLSTILHGKPPQTGGGGGAGGRTVVRSGTVNSGPNQGKRVIEYSDGTREYQ